MRIVSLTCSNTEIVTSLGLADALVGVDDHSDWPAPVVAKLARVGPDLQIDLDAVEALRPDIVLASLTVPGHETVVEGLEGRGIPHLAPVTATLDDVYRDIDAIARALGVPERGAAVVSHMRSALAGDRVATPHEPPGILVQWWPRPVIAPGSESWASEVIRAAGGRNVLEHEAVKSRPLEDEEVAALAPDAIIISWCGVKPSNYRSDVVYRNPAFQQMPAVRDRRVFQVAEAFLGRPGPRLVEGVRAVRQVVETVLAGGCAPEPGERGYGGPDADAGGNWDQAASRVPRGAGE